MNIFKKLFGNSEAPKNKNSEEKTSIDNSNFKRTDEELDSLSESDQALFKKMLGKISNVSNTPDSFKEELYDSLNRYYSSPELKIKLNLTDDSGKIYSEHEAFDSTYNEWKQISTIQDRRSVLFELWDQTDFDKLQKWQIIERFVKDRNALSANKFEKHNISQDDFQDIRLIVSLSKLYRVFDAIPNALHYAKGAFQLRPDLDIVKIEYANVLHLDDSNEDKDLAHKLIAEIIENKIKAEKSDTFNFFNHFIFSVDYIDSSIFAASFLNAENCDKETWEKLSEEYYWCPVFRFEHAVFLNKNGDNIEAFAKLNSLADEFPWFKSGVVANVNAINDFRIKNNNPLFMEEEMRKMDLYRSKWKD